MADRERRNGLSWCRLWADVLDSPRLGRLPDSAFRVWILLLAYCARQGVGDVIPDDLTEVAWVLRIPEPEVRAAMDILTQAGLVTGVSGSVGCRIKGWPERQPRSDCDPTGADRQRRFRESRAKLDAVTRDTSVTSHTDNGRVTVSEAEAEKNIPPSLREAPPQKAKPARKTRAASRPADFALNETDLRVAHECGVSVQAELPKFCDYHDSKGSIFADWHAAWRTWCRKSRDFSNRSTASGPSAVEMPGRDRARGTTGGGFQRVNDPKLGQASAARATHGWCRAHPGRAAVSAAGLCEQCRDAAREAVA